MAFASFLDAAIHPPTARAVPREGHETSNPRYRGRAYRAREARNGDLINRTRSDGCPHATRSDDETHFETIGVVVGRVRDGHRRRCPRMVSIARCVSTRSVGWSDVQAVDGLGRG